MQRKRILKRKEVLETSIVTDIKDVQIMYRMFESEIPKELVRQAEQILKSKLKELKQLERSLSEE